MSFSIDGQSQGEESVWWDSPTQSESGVTSLDGSSSDLLLFDDFFNDLGNDHLHPKCGKCTSNAMTVFTASHACRSCVV